MRLTINGEPREMTDTQTVRHLLQHLGFGEKPVVVEINQRALFPREISDTLLHDGDVIEVVQITAGG